MAGRFPFGNQGGHDGQNPLHNAQVRAALGLSQVDEALYLQRQQELQRDFQIRQMLLQEQIDQQSRLDTMLHEQQLKAIGEHLQEFPDLQQHYRSLLLNEQLQRQEEGLMLRERAQLQQQEEMRRRHLATQQQAQSKPAAAAVPTVVQPPKSVQSNAAVTAARFRDIAADSLAGNAVKRSELEKRQFAKPDDDILPSRQRKKERTTSEDDGERKPKPKQKHHKKQPPQEQQTQQPIQNAPSSPQEEPTVMEVEEESTMKPSALALLDFASSTPETPVLPVFVSPPPEVITPLGTVADLLSAANSEDKTDDAANALVGIKKHVEWSDDSEQEDEPVVDYTIAIKKGEAINLPGFMSVLPQLPEEPQLKAPVPKKKKKRKHKGLLDDDSIDEKTNGKSKSHKHEQKDAKTSEAKAAELNVVEYPYPIDTWWPSVSTIRRERKAAAEPQDEDAFTEEPQILSEDSQFRAHTAKIHDNFANEVEPGVLEKIPHCKIHRMLMKKRKNPSAPELVYCWQVTELYPNDIMVACAHCGTWRHAACGGHHKPYSVREGIHSPFTAVCDRCCDEEKILRNHPLGRKRIDRQRTEQIRRGLATSACMRQASFSKHGGTYKWPLGSVSATHIGGHTRSVHSRHDKAEKQWTDMATRLGRGYGYRPKERVKVRTKELERLLVSVEDAEGHTDRHNMMLFLLHDTNREHPVGFESKTRNMFDPEEDDVPLNVTAGSEPPPLAIEEATTEIVPEDGASGDEEEQQKEPSTCSRRDCTKKQRFDSLFCSDSCGVSALESDLLRTFQYSSDIHPSMLRN